MNRYAIGLFAALSFVGVFGGSLGADSQSSSQIPSANGVIHACVRMDRDGDAGKLARLVAENEACKRNEQRVTWSVAGPKGEPGAPGAAGAPGAPGPQGPQGSAGPSSPAGGIEGRLASCVPGASLARYLVHVPGRQFNAYTGADGAFRFDHVPPGVYDITVELGDDEEVVVPAVQVSDEMVTLPVPVQLATCAPPPPTCDGDAAIRFFRDRDQDGFGDPSSSVLACTQPAGFVLQGGDCDDFNHRTNPAAPEFLNGVDDDCDGQVDEGAIGEARSSALFGDEVVERAARANEQLAVRRHGRREHFVI
jgi:hypothetical protein